MNAKALEAANRAINTKAGEGIDLMCGETAVNTYLSSVWKRFDPEDEGTWPKTKAAPSGLLWFVYRRNHPEKFGFLEFKVAGSPKWSWVVAYADPADLLPKETP